MAQAVYVLCTLTSLTCAWLLIRAYSRNGLRLLFWAGLCFVAITITNVLLFVDLAVYPEALDLRPWRSGVTLIGFCMLLYGLIFEAK